MAYKKRQYGPGFNPGSRRGFGKGDSRKGSSNQSWKGHRDISGTHWYQIVKNAKTRGLSFNITLIQVWEQYEKQGGCCALTGMPLRFAQSRRTKKDTNASLDRINSNKGYEVDNIQWIHKALQPMKSAMTQTEFLGWCGAVTRHTNRKRQSKDEPSLIDIFNQSETP